MAVSQRNHTWPFASPKRDRRSVWSCKPPGDVFYGEMSQGMGEKDEKVKWM